MACYVTRNRNKKLKNKELETIRRFRRLQQETGTTQARQATLFDFYQLPHSRGVFETFISEAPSSFASLSLLFNLEHQRQTELLSRSNPRDPEHPYLLFWD
jgi:hypothetical protein